MSREVELAIREARKKKLASITPLVPVETIRKVNLLETEISMVKESLKKIPKATNGSDGYTPIKNIDYFDGKDGKAGKDGKDGIDGKDGKPGKDGINGKDGSPDTPQEIRDKLSTLKGRDRLDAKHIQNIDKYVSLSVTQFGGGNGGVSDGKVKVDASDTADYLENQVEAGSNVTITKNAGKLKIAASGVGGTTNHDELNNLGYTESGHTGFEPARGVDDNYVTDSEKSVLTELDTSGIYKDASNVSAIDLENRQLS